MNTLPIKLEQHTPILHFQADLADAGATLRVTELKPKLDRYLSANSEIKKEWRIPKTNALNYKLKITVGQPTKELGSKPPMFFGQGKKPLLLSKTKNPKEDILTLQFFCLIPGLRDCLQNIDWIKFFLSTNFGTRQSKGYGSFFKYNAPAPINLIGEEIRTDEKTTYRVDSYFCPKSKTWEGVMNEISDVYKCLRSGINEGGQNDGIYFKSLMFAYAKSKGQWWDKRVIKEVFFPEKLEVHRKKHKGRTDPDPLAEQPRVEPNKSPYPMFRDNLGLATDEFWKDYSFKVKKKGPKDIVRFKSPILFKPLFIGNQWYVFILHREIPKEFRNASFTIRKDDTQLGFKTYNNFSMKDFLNYVFTIKDYGKYLSKNNDVKRSDTILGNLEEIKNNYKPLL